MCQPLKTIKAEKKRDGRLGEVYAPSTETRCVEHIYVIYEQLLLKARRAFTCLCRLIRAEFDASRLRRKEIIAEGSFPRQKLMPALCVQGNYFVYIDSSHVELILVEREGAGDSAHDRCCCCCSHISSSWSQDRLQSLWS